MNNWTLLFEDRFETSASLDPGGHWQTSFLTGQVHEPEPVYFKSSGTLYAHGLVGHVRAGQNLAVLTEDVAAP